jgi:Na+/H+ antiporter NhaD/arsenite permease-like protein
MRTIFQALEKDKMFSISLLLAAATSVFIRPEWSYINYKVLILLFNLMLIIAALKDMRLLDKAALFLLEKCKDTRTLSLIFILVTFFASMLVTNDVALLTFVPLCIITFKKTSVDPMKTIIFQTLAANIGSSLTPMGNPQNLFLFAHYDLSGFQFFSATIPFVAIGMLWLIILNKRVASKNIKLKDGSSRIKVSRKSAVYILLFLFIVISVFGAVDYKYTFFITLTLVILLDKHLIASVDYFLMGTFICFFVFIGNVANIYS